MQDRTVGVSLRDEARTLFSAPCKGRVTPVALPALPIAPHWPRWTFLGGGIPTASLLGFAGPVPSCTVSRLTVRFAQAYCRGMASEHFVSQVWLGLLDAERLLRYYGALAARLQRWHLSLTAFVAIGSTGALGALLLEAPVWVPEALAAAVAAVALWTSYYGHASKAALAETSRDGCADLALAWRDLWTRISALDDDEAAEEIAVLRRREEMATARVPAHLAANRRLNQRCAEEAYRVLGDEYAVS